jgi:hypothetical protein
MDFKEIKREQMAKAEQPIQIEYLRNTPIFLNCNDIRNADMNEFGDIAKKMMEV